MEDSEILRLLHAEPQEGLRLAIAQYRGGVAAITTRILRGRSEDIEECVADTFLRVWKTARQNKLDTDADTLKGFIFSTARNVALTRYRKLRRENFLPLDETGEFADETDLLETLLQKETDRELQNAVLSLKEPDCQIFFRRYFLFESIKEIAAYTKCSEAQVKNCLYRGKGPLEAAFRERGICYENT